MAVTDPLADWSRRQLRVPADRVWYVPNFVCVSATGRRALVPGEKGFRIICVANLRREKDHLNLLQAMKLVLREIPAAHLILLGAGGDAEYQASIEQQIQSVPLRGRVFWLGSRNDVIDILRSCDLGVLSSASEGLPLSLIEYGFAGLASVATDVGQCGEVLENGRSGVLVPPGRPDALARAIVSLLQSPRMRSDLGERLAARARRLYGAEAVIGQICGIYESVLGIESPAAA